MTLLTILFGCCDELLVTVSLSLAVEFVAVLYGDYS